jgi:uncharacterized membrane protein YedE/YeeE
MGRIIAALGAGILFGLGLSVSRLIDPAKVLGFLDVSGDWDPSLALVMAGALAVTLPVFRLTRALSKPALDARFHMPARRDIELRLVTGAALFGVGWGLVGFCPGPAVASLAFGRWESALFVVAMIVGMAAHRFTVAGLGGTAPSAGGARPG